VLVLGLSIGRQVCSIVKGETTARTDGRTVAGR
jgi:hypothetical protein